MQRIWCILCFLTVFLEYGEKNQWRKQHTKHKISNWGPDEFSLKEVVHRLDNHLWNPDCLQQDSMRNAGWVGEAIRSHGACGWLGNCLEEAAIAQLQFVITIKCELRSGQFFNCFKWNWILKENCLIFIFKIS